MKAYKLRISQQITPGNTIKPTLSLLTIFLPRKEAILKFSNETYVHTFLRIRILFYI